jgi:hypothetical protein
MAGLVPAIHVFKSAITFKTWMLGIKPARRINVNA